eukprot:scaffold1.g5377.t1
MQRKAEELEHAALCAALAETHLESGGEHEAEALLRRALELRLASEAADANAADEDDWETSWDEGRVPTPIPPASTGASERRSSPRRASPSGWDATATSSRHTPPPATSARGAMPSSAGSAVGREELAFGGGHILEVHNLSPSYTTTQLEQFAAVIAGRDTSVPPVVKWVDDYHALILFADPASARQALQAVQAPGGAAPRLEVRPWLDASRAARALPPSELAPPRPRQATTAAVARRLIGAGLGINLRDREEEGRLRGARQQRKQAAQQRQQALDSAWDD